MALMYDDDDDSFEEFVLTKKKPSVVVVADDDVERVAVVVSNPRHEQVFEVAMNKWFDWVRDVSFDADFCPISMAQANALMNEISCFTIVGGQERPVAGASLNQEDRRLLDDLKQDLARRMQSSSSSTWFVKLCTRSPKDSVFDMFSERTADLVRREMERTDFSFLQDRSLSREQRALLYDNAVVCSFFRGANKAMCVQSVDEAFLLLRQSLRFRQDLQHALKKSPWEELFLVLRTWSNEVSLDGEYRIFVYNRRLCAASQYFWFAYFSHLQHDHAKVLEALRNFVDKELLPRVPYENFVGDVCVSSDKVRLIELNPYGDVSGTCLYSWEKDGDLLRGERCAEATLRVRVEPMKDVRKHALVPCWDTWITTHYPMPRLKKERRKKKW